MGHISRCSMQSYQKEFIEFAIEQGVLKFGEFTLKSGRISPYFFNAGLFNTGMALAKLGRFYAAAIEDAGVAYDVVFGPAYKGIPLAASLSVALADHYGKDMPYVFNRKEAKTHGEGGNLVGAVPAAALIALDRQEKGQGELSAIQEVERDFGMKVISIVGLNQVLDYVSEKPELKQYAEAISAYRDQYGVS